jgi:type IV pilus assembly protein PilF
MDRWAIAVSLAFLLAGCASSAERQALEARKGNIVLLNTQLAGAYLQRGQLDIALQHADRAIAVGPEDAQANNMMALIQWRLGNHQDADKYFKRTLKLDPKDSKGRNNYGTFLCERGDVDAAVKQFNAALADLTYATPAQANLNAALCLMRKPMPAEAERYFRETLRLDPKQPQALQGMAKITYDSGRSFSARGFIQRFLEVSSDTPAALLLAVKIEEALGDKNAASSYALRLKGKFPTSVEAQELEQLSLKRR